MLSQTVERILTINTGSSSLKIALYEMGSGETRTLSGEVERIGMPEFAAQIGEQKRRQKKSQAGF